MIVEGTAIGEDLRCPQCGRAVKSLICGHCGSRLPPWQADLYGATVRQIAKLGGNRADTGYEGGDDGDGSTYGGTANSESEEQSLVTSNNEDPCDYLTPQLACNAKALTSEAESHRQLSLADRAAILQAGKQCPEHGIVFTPKHVARFLFNLLSPLHPRIVLDAGSGNGDLSRPWRDSSTVIEYELGYGRDFSNCPDSIDTDLVVCNPPFNEGQEKKFLRRIIQVVPETTPIVLFATHRVRLGSYASSADWRWCRDEWPQISSIVSLPRGIFRGVNETVEILLFRTPHLLPHYFLPGDTE